MSSQSSLSLSRSMLPNLRVQNPGRDALAATGLPAGSSSRQSAQHASLSRSPSDMGPLGDEPGGLANRGAGTRGAIPPTLRKLQPLESIRRGWAERPGTQLGASPGASLNPSWVAARIALAPPRMHLRPASLKNILGDVTDVPVSPASHDDVESVGVTGAFSGPKQAIQRPSARRAFEDLQSPRGSSDGSEQIRPSQIARSPLDQFNSASKECMNARARPAAFGYERLDVIARRLSDGTSGQELTVFNAIAVENSAGPNITFSASAMETSECASIADEYQ